MTTGSGPKDDVGAPNGSQNGGVTDAEVQARREKAMALRCAGFSFRQIGKALGISHTAAANHVRAAVAESREATAESVDQLRAISHARHEQLINRLWPKALPNPRKVDDPDQPGKTKTITDDPDGGAVDRILRTIQADARIMGYEAPQRHEITMEMVQVTIGKILEIVDEFVPDDRVPELLSKVDRVLSQGDGALGDAVKLLPAASDSSD